MNQQVTDYINQAPDEHRIIMQEIRQLISQCLTNAQESIKWGRPVFSAQKDFAYLKAAKAYVTLGFFSVEKLDDPNKLLEGTGKDMRHIKIKRAADLDKALLTKWFTALASN
jgi:hypothetical protein